MSRPYAVSLFRHDTPFRNPSLFCIKLFCGPFSLMLHRMVSFFKRYQYHQTVASLSSSNSRHPRLLLVFSISLLSEASPPPLRITLTHFALSSYERALRLPTSFSISGLARLGVKPRLCRSSWRAFASTHPFMLSSTSPRETLIAYPILPPWNLFSFTVEFTLSFPCSHCNPPLSPRCGFRSS